MISVCPQSHCCGILVIDRLQNMNLGLQIRPAQKFWRGASYAGVTVNRIFCSGLEFLGRP